MLRNVILSFQIKGLALSVCAVSLMGCQQMSNKAEASSTEPSKIVKPVAMTESEKSVVAKMEWVKTANALQDANKALAKPAGEKIEIIAFSGRGKSFPGLTLDEYNEIEPYVSYRYAQGSGDTLQGPTHRQLRKDMRAYVKTYNRTIYDSVTRTK